MQGSNIEKMPRKRASVDYVERKRIGATYHKTPATVATRGERKMQAYFRKRAAVNRALNKRRISADGECNKYATLPCAAKRMYRTQQDALSAALLISRHTKALRVYKCPYCKMYHLTSHALRSKSLIA